MRVWYVAYGSNLHAARLAWYIGGGCPPGGKRTYPGCRDRRPPSRSVPVSLPGGIYFAGESGAWTGGMAFYDPHLPGEAAARAYLVTLEQFTDIAAQEMYRPVDDTADLVPASGAAIDAAVATGRATLGPGRYETLVCPGSRGGVPMLTFTAPEGASGVRYRPPAPTYLAMIARGLRESHGWTAERIASYLAARPGVADAWPPEVVAALVTDALAAEVLAAEVLAVEVLARDGLAAEGLARDGLAVEVLARDGLAAEVLARDGLTAEGLAREEIVNRAGTHAARERALPAAPRGSHRRG